METGKISGGSGVRTVLRFKGSREMSTEEMNPEQSRNAAENTAEMKALETYGAALGRSIGRPWVTYGIIGVCVLIFVWMCVLDPNSFMNPDSELLVRFGADYSPITIEAGQWWRLITSGFVHIGILHILCNLYTLYGFGNLTERIFGHSLFFLIYFGSLLTGSLLSLAMYSEPVISGGASGAIFGVFGALAAYLLRMRSEIPGPVFKTLLEELKSFAVGALMLVFIAWVNNWAHLGGALGGFVFGFVAAVPVCSPQRSRKIWQKALILLFLIPVIAVPAWFGVRNAKRSPFPEFVHRYEILESEMIARSKEFFNREKGEKITGEAYPKFLEEQHLPDIQAMGKIFNELPLERLYPIEKKEFEKLRFFAEKRLEAVQFEILGIRENSEEYQRKAKESYRAIEEMLKGNGDESQSPEEG